MNSDEISKKSAAVELLLGTSYRHPGQNEGAPACSTNDFENLLPQYTCLQKISKVQNEIQLENYRNLLVRIHDLKSSVRTLDGILNSASTIAEEFKSLVDSSELLVLYLKNSRKNDAFPLPLQHHRAFLQIFEKVKCILVSVEKKEDAFSSWEKIIPLLRSTLEILLDFVELFETRLQGHQVFQHEIQKLIGDMSKLKFPLNMM